MIEEDISDIVEVLRECAEDSRKVEGDYYADQFATDASVFDDAAHAIEKLRDEIIRLNNEATVIVTQTQRVMRLTDAERAAVASCIADDEAATASAACWSGRGVGHDSTRGEQPSGEADAGVPRETGLSVC